MYFSEDDFAVAEAVASGQTARRCSGAGGLPADAARTGSDYRRNQASAAKETHLKGEVIAAVDLNLSTKKIAALETTYRLRPILGHAQLMPKATLAASNRSWNAVCRFRSLATFRVFRFYRPILLSRLGQKVLQRQHLGDTHVSDVRNVAPVRVDHIFLALQELKNGRGQASKQKAIGLIESALAITDELDPFSSSGGVLINETQPGDKTNPSTREDDAQ
jgi:hypothetical protein